LLAAALFICASAGRAATVAVSVTPTGQVFVPVRINGSRVLSFLLDTAAPTSADPSIVRELKLQAEGGYRGSGSGAATFDVLRVAEVTLAVGTHTLRTPLFGTPVKQLEPRLGRTIDGILGAELFAKTAIEIDYEHRVIRIGAAPKHGAVRIPIVMQHGFRMPRPCWTWAPVRSPGPFCSTPARTRRSTSTSRSPMPTPLRRRAAQPRARERARAASQRCSPRRRAP
jgi:hypothetical protein